MRSMTGYGRAAAERGGRRVTIEIRSVNHRFLDVKVRGPMLEPQIEELVAGKLRERVERGAVIAVVRLERAAAGGFHIDRDAARAVHGALRELAAELGTSPPTLELVVNQPGVIGAPDPGGDDTELLAAITAAADGAITELLEMRDVEGAALARELETRTAALRELVAEVAAAAETVPADVKRRLDERLRRLLAEFDAEVDSARLAQEVALLADRADVTEELVRLGSHIDQLVAVFAGDGGPVGRRLDFLLQEVGRELNTIGSKTPSAEIVSRVVAAKVELEKLREQAQNVE